MAKILATAKQAGSVNSLKLPIQELISRGYEVDVLATGNDNEVVGFGDLEHTRQENFQRQDFEDRLRGYDLLLVGLSGHDTPDGKFVQAANRLSMPSIGVLDQNGNYKYRMPNTTFVPSFIAVMEPSCIPAMDAQLSEDRDTTPAYVFAAKARAKVVGWTAFDDFAEKREAFTPEDRERVLTSIGLNPDKPAYCHLSQNVDVDGNPGFLEYEKRVTQAVFETAADLGIKLVVKPHPGEVPDFTRNLASRYDHKYITARPTETIELMLSADAITAGKSTCLVEGCLFDRNTGGIVPDCSDQDFEAYPAITQRAIPYTQTWQNIGGVLRRVYSQDPGTLATLAEDRKRFSVDGKASKRLADLVEETL